MLNTLVNVLLTLALFLVALVAIFEVWRALRSGVTGLKSWPLADRTQQPIWFWVCTLFQLAVGTLCFWLAMRGTISLLS